MLLRQWPIVRGAAGGTRLPVVDGHSTRLAGILALRRSPHSKAESTACKPAGTRFALWTWQSESVRGEERDAGRPSLPDIAVRAALAASPRAAGSLLVVYEGLRDRHAGRAEQVVREAVAGLDDAEVSRRLAHDDILDAAFAAAVEAGARSGLESKRRLLGRVVRRALENSALVDQAVLLVGILAQIDAPHVTCLEKVRRAQDDALAAGEVAPRARWAEREIVPRINEAGAQYPAAVLTALSALGLVDASGIDDGEVLVKAVTPLGVALLDDLRAAGDG
jgi:hypothetical protein